MKWGVLMNLENLGKMCNLRIICVLLLPGACNRCVYRVYTNDGGFVDYEGFDKVPRPIRDWLNVRNTFDYILPGVMFISGVKVV